MSLPVDDFEQNLKLGSREVIIIDQLKRVEL